MTILRRRELPRLVVWVDSRLVVDSDAPCTAQSVDLVKLTCTAGRQSWRDPVQPGVLTLVVSVADRSDVVRWPGATVAAALYTPGILGDHAEWLGCWSVEEVSWTPTVAGERSTVTVTGTDLIGVLARTPQASPLVYGAWRQGPAYASPVTTAEDWVSKLDFWQAVAGPLGTVAVRRIGEPPPSGDLDVDQWRNGWAAVQLHVSIGQTLYRPAGQSLNTTLDMCQIEESTLTWRHSSREAVDTVIAGDVVLSTWDPASGHPEVTWDVGRYLSEPAALSIAAEALAASGTVGWTMGEAVVDVAAGAGPAMSSLIALEAPWSLVTLTGPVHQVSPHLASGAARAVDSLRHERTADTHTITIGLSDPLPIASPIRYGKAPGLTVGSITAVPGDATYGAPPGTGWEHLDKTYHAVLGLGTDL